MSKSSLVRAFRPCARRACLRGGRTQPTMLRHDDNPPCPLRLILQLARATPEPARPTTCCEPSVRACPRAPLLTRPRPVGAQILFALLGPAMAVLTPSFVTGMMSRQILRRQRFRSSMFPLPQSCTRVAFDIGTNNGADTVALAAHGFCVVGVDANPAMIELAQKHVAKNVANFDSRVRLANIGISESPGNLTFYVTPSKVHSSFEYAKARRHVHKETEIVALRVSTQTCEWLWQYLPAGVRPYYMKVDIEERHYACIEALASLQGEHLLPSYVSWELHEQARGLPYPVLDAKLITLMFGLGYRTMKIKSNEHAGAGGFSGVQSPEEVLDVTSNTSAWRSVPSVLANGLGWPRQSGDWWDYHMKLT